MDEQTRKLIGAVSETYAYAITVLATKLSKAGVLDLPNYCSALRRTATRAEEVGPNPDAIFAEALPPYLLRHLAEMIDRGPDGPRVFTPVVIEGGKDDA